jgi:hypothetical protein
MHPDMGRLHKAAVWAVELSFLKQAMLADQSTVMDPTPPEF